MKKYLVCLIVFLCASLGYADQTIVARGTGAFTASQVVVARPARLIDVGVQTDGTAAVTVLLYDHASAASGEIIAFVYLPLGVKVGGWNCPVPRGAVNGIYAAVSGTGVTRILVSYDPQ